MALGDRREHFFEKRPLWAGPVASCWLGWDDGELDATLNVQLSTFNFEQGGGDRRGRFCRKAPPGRAWPGVINAHFM